MLRGPLVSFTVLAKYIQLLKTFANSRIICTILGRPRGYFYLNPPPSFPLWLAKGASAWERHVKLESGLLDLIWLGHPCPLLSLCSWTTVQICQQERVQYCVSDYFTGLEVLGLTCWIRVPMPRFYHDELTMSGTELRGSPNHCCLSLSSHPIQRLAEHLSSNCFNLDELSPQPNVEGTCDTFLRLGFYCVTVHCVNAVIKQPE